MTSAFAKAVCRLLIALAVWSPYQIAQAGMIGTGPSVQASQAERGALLNFISRSDVASQLQAFGLDPATAKDRVAAMTDDEVRHLAGRINTAPAGADVASLLLLVVVVAVIWWAWKR
jgi:predicted kinase